MTAGEIATFGTLLRRFRTAAGLTQEELAERAGLSRRGINDLERGARLLPRKDTVALLADALSLAGDDRSAFFAAARRTVPASGPSGVPPVHTIPIEATGSSLPGGTITFLFTDIVGSTSLLQQLGPQYAHTLGEHQTLLRAAFAANDGVEVDTQGDSFFVAFASAPQAVAAADDTTRALAEHSWPQGVALRVRIGLHTGTPQVVGDHYVGLDVHRAARIAACGHGGQILLSAATRALVENDLPAGCELRDLGAHRLRDLQQPEYISQLVLADPNLPSEFPPLKTLDLHPHNLPVQSTPLLDREEQVPALTAMLRRDDVRLLTLSGPGGIGKTRLAIQVAAELIEAFPDGVWFVRLSRLVDPGLVVPTIAQTLGLKESGRQPIAEMLRAHLAEKQRLLLVLDNFEQVVGAAGEISTLLGTSRGLHLLVTSRVALRLRGEHTYSVPPLPVASPDRLPPLDQLTQYAAVALFAERAQAAQPAFTVTAANAPAIAEICVRLDGLPLAIELAAARVKLLPPPALLARLSSQLRLLTGGARDLEERQQTMRATLAWSYDLLQSEERVLLRRLAVFVGGCSIEAAEAVCTEPGLETARLDLDLLEGLSALVDHSLVQQRTEDKVEGEPRFGMLHVVREYALERLSASEVGREAEALRRAHAAYYLTVAERAEPELSGPEAERWLDHLEREHDNLRAALGWAREHGEAETGLRLAAALLRFWLTRGHLREGRTWVEGMLELPFTAREAKAATLRACALHASGTLAMFAGDYATAQTQLEQALPLARTAGDLQTEESALSNLGRIAQNQGLLPLAVTRFEESLALDRTMGNWQGIAGALTNLGAVAYDQGDLERAAAWTQEALTLFLQASNRRGSAICLANLGQVARRRGELAQAEALGREALELFRELGDPRRCTEGLEVMASTAGVAGHGVRAARLLGAAMAQREALEAPQPANEQADVAQAVATARAALGEEAWAAAFAAGRALTLEEALAEALAPA
jgi:predicted ATPase/class 3 adenylate cyclase